MRVLVEWDRAYACVRACVRAWCMCAHARLILCVEVFARARLRIILCDQVCECARTCVVRLGLVECCDLGHLMIFLPTGYGDSEGSASELSTYLDAQAAVNWVSNTSTPRLTTYMFSHVYDLYVP